VTISAVRRIGSTVRRRTVGDLPYHQGDDDGGADRQGGGDHLLADRAAGEPRDRIEAPDLEQDHQRGDADGQRDRQSDHPVIAAEARLDHGVSRDQLGLAVQQRVDAVQQAGGQQAGHHEDRETAEPDMQHLLIAIAQIGGPCEPQPDDQEDRQQMPHTGHRRQRVGLEADAAAARPDAGGDRLAALQDHHDQHHVIDQQDQLLQGLAHVVVHAPEQADLVHRLAEHRDAGEDLHAAQNVARRGIGQPRQPQPGLIGRHQHPGDRADGAEHHRGVDQTEDHQTTAAIDGQSDARHQIADDGERRHGNEVEQQPQQRERQQADRLPDAPRQTADFAGRRRGGWRVVARRKLVVVGRDIVRDRLGIGLGVIGAVADIGRLLGHIGGGGIGVTHAGPRRGVDGEARDGRAQGQPGHASGATRQHQHRDQFGADRQHGARRRRVGHDDARPDEQIGQPVDQAAHRGDALDQDLEPGRYLIDDLRQDAVGGQRDGGLGGDRDGGARRRWDAGRRDRGGRGSGGGGGRGRSSWGDRRVGGDFLQRAQGLDQLGALGGIVEHGQQRRRLRPRQGGLRGGGGRSGRPSGRSGQHQTRRHEDCGDDLAKTVRRGPPRRLPPAQDRAPSDFVGGL
jgi:hypothetical protein